MFVEMFHRFKWASIIIIIIIMLSLAKRSTHHFFRSLGEAALRSASFENLIFRRVEPDPYRLVSGLHCLHAGFKKQSDVHSHFCARAAVNKATRHRPVTSSTWDAAADFSLKGEKGKALNRFAPIRIWFPIKSTRNLTKTQHLTVSLWIRLYIKEKQ